MTAVCKQSCKPSGFPLWRLLWTGTRQLSRHLNSVNQEELILSDSVDILSCVNIILGVGLQ